MRQSNFPRPKKKVDPNLFNAVVHMLMKQSPEFERVHIWTSANYKPMGGPIRENISRSKSGERYYVNSHEFSDPNSDPSLAKAMLKLRQLHVRHPQTVFAFAHCGESRLSTKLDFLRIERIQLWDLPTIVLRFENQIESLRYMRAYLLEVLEYVKSNLELYLPYYSELMSISPGHENWSQYQVLLKDIFDLLFNPPLSISYYENSDRGGFNRRDIVYPNYSSDGFWSQVRVQYHGSIIIIEAKNHKKAIGKHEIVATSKYLKEKGVGLFSIIATRKGISDSGYHALVDEWSSNQKMLVILDDNDIVKMLKYRITGRYPEEIVRCKIEKLRLSL